MDGLFQRPDRLWGVFNREESVMKLHRFAEVRWFPA
jgi:hypothetical protein